MAACLGASLVLLGGCAPSKAPGAGLGDPYPAPLNDPQISVQPLELREWLGFQPAYVVDDGERPMQVELPVRNLTENRYLLDYRFIFHDRDGMELEPVMGWEMVALGPKQNLRLKGSALSMEAASYRVEVKWAR
jgi:hypothetical protein